MFSQRPTSSLTYPGRLGLPSNPCFSRAFRNTIAQTKASGRIPPNNLLKEVINLEWNCLVGPRGSGREFFTSKRRPEIRPAPWLCGKMESGDLPPCVFFRHPENKNGWQACKKGLRENLWSACPLHWNIERLHGYVISATSTHQTSIFWTIRDSLTDRYARVKIDGEKMSLSLQKTHVPPLNPCVAGFIIFVENCPFYQIWCDKLYQNMIFNKMRWTYG